MSRHPFALTSLVLLGTSPVLRAQAVPDSAHPRALCWTARPAPRCRVLLLTNLGAYADVGSGGGARLSEDVGLMVNVSRQAAIGATYYLTMDETGLFTSGPAIRYRRWLSNGRSLDVAVGILAPAKSVDRGAVMGVIRYGVGPYLAFALRPEILRSCGYDLCDLVGAGATRFRVLAGVEIGSWPGAAVPLAAGLVGLVAVLVNPPHLM